MVNVDLSEVKALIFDIEGTTTSISFVKDVLFPYARNILAEHVEQNWNTAELNDDIKLLRQQSVDDIASGLDAPQISDSDDLNEVKQSLVANILWQMDKDRKTTALKQLQGTCLGKRVGSKTEAASYRNILAAINQESSHVAFFTDIPREALAASEAGIKSVLVVREGNAPLTAEEKSLFPLISSFGDIVL
ncbi:Enolase-phosphatase E1 [Halotydeus destructor]|nr:Enolase-phosphatase E1 [Halotydeus destructor]